ncbi:hypothetical protein [Actinoplanes sp. N902-109]|uniref:hypothetical protein n=1 Tax=Actinoplanes sp. (strain N902-109) TaxID=649831 RepID=UPI0003294A1C|nr:hypothetical protein [Actinoplanes sp. N902-109]AGL20946.1 hypothetical protein L083_7436 [Actinoplanes sp. N902-109]
MADYVPQIITAVGALAGSLGGVAITQQHQRRTAALERADKRRAELRAHIVEFLINADEWASHMDIVIVVMWKATDRDTIELSNSEMAKKAGELRYAVTKELKHLLGLVGDPPLQEAVHVFHDLWLKVSDQMMGPVTDKKRKSDFTAVEESMKYLGSLRRATIEIRNAALPLLRITVEDPQPVRWWQLRRRRAARGALTR